MVRKKEFAAILVLFTTWNFDRYFEIKFVNLGAEVHLTLGVVSFVSLVVLYFREIKEFVAITMRSRVFNEIIIPFCFSMIMLSSAALIVFLIGWMKPDG